MKPSDFQSELNAEANFQVSIVVARFFGAFLAIVRQNLKLESSSIAGRREI